MPMTTPWFHFAVALGIGLMIGLERERRKGEGPSRKPAGIRTFALASLAGAVAMHLGGAGLLAVACGGIALLAALAVLRGPQDDPGLTTEIGLLAAPLLGGLAVGDPALASGLGVTVAVLFAAKVPLHGFIKGALTESDVKDTLVLATATLVIWPQLPDRFLGPWQAINPHNIWLLVVLVLLIGACGKVATRLLGERLGLPLAGLASGFASSAATIGSMGAAAVREPALMPGAVSGAALSSLSTFVQMAVVLATVSPPTLVLMAPSLVAGGAVAGVYGLFFAWRAGGGAGGAGPAQGSAVSLGAALGLAAIMGVMLVIAAALRDWFGEAGVIAGAAVGGSIDTHSAAISVASLVMAGSLTPAQALVPILVAMSSNALLKIVLALSMGTRDFAARVVPGIILSMMAAWLAGLI